MSYLRKIFYLLSKNERKRAYLLMGMIIVMALLDMIGVASILPFITVLTNPDLVETNYLINSLFKISNLFGVKTNQQFLFAMGIFVFLLLVISLMFKALTNYTQVRFVSMREFSLGKRLLESYLHQPYSWFLNKHSASLGKTIVSEVSKVIGKGFTPMMNLIAQSTVTIALIALLLVVDIKLTLIVGITLGTTYALIFIFTKSFITSIGIESVKSNEKRFTSLSEAFGAVKEIKVGGLEQTYIKRFSDPAKTLAQNTASVAIISQMPRFAVEAITFGGMLLVVLYLMARSGNFINAVPIISVYAYAGYRLMPALQLIYGSITQLRFVGPALDILLEDLKDINKHNSQKDKNLISIKKDISLKHIHYNYPNASRTALNNVNFNIPACSTVAIVGATGSGKTTTVDIILGLLEPQLGSLEVDGQVIDKNNYRAWQNCIGYVPQQIFLADDTVAANIAFGVEKRDIDLKAVENAAKIANLHNFVINELPKQYQTQVGERGIRLSGGQRQRIGIARALYNNPKVLVFDEATSALDNLTEQAVMEAVYNLKKNITIILIAHRLSTVKKCDKIFFLEKGELKAQGTFEKLREINENFRANAENL